MLTSPEVPLLVMVPTIFTGLEPEIEIPYAPFDIPLLLVSVRLPVPVMPPERVIGWPRPPVPLLVMVVPDALTVRLPLMFIEPFEPVTFKVIFVTLGPTFPVILTGELLPVLLLLIIDPELLI